MSQQHVLESAKQGNPSAIAILINQNLQQKGISAKVSRKDTCLRIMLESSEVPNQSNLVEFIFNGIKKLEMTGIDTLQVFGRQTGDDVPAWSKSIVLRAAQSSISQNQGQTSNLHPSKSKLSSEDETGFKVKRNGQELIASDIEELKEWIHKGQIALSDYAYNPILKKWMYVQEFAEIESIVKQQESSTQANQYDQMSFVFAGLGLFNLVLFPITGMVFFPIIGGILLIIGMVFSAMCYTRKGAMDTGKKAVPTHANSGSSFVNSEPSLQAKAPKSRITTALLAIFLGGFGFHFFYLEAWGWGLICILLNWTYIPTIVGVILGIRYFTISDKEFERKAKKVKGAFGRIEF